MMAEHALDGAVDGGQEDGGKGCVARLFDVTPVSYTHLRAHETVLDLVCRLLLEKKNNNRLITTHTLTTV